MATSQVDRLRAPPVRLSTDPAAALTEAIEVFPSAADAGGGEIVRAYDIAGLTVDLRFAGPNLVDTLTTAFEHHPPAPSRPQPKLTVYVWDWASTGVPLPPIPEEAADGGTTGAARIAQPPRVRSKYRPEQPSITLLDSAAGCGVFAAADAAVLPYWVKGAPFRILLHWWMADHGRQLIHAGAVGTEHGGLLLVGRGGVGKSSSTLACLDSSLGFVSDDYTLVSDSPPHAYSIYSTAKLSAEQARRFPELVSALANPDRLDTEKALFLVSRRYPDHILDGFPLRAIVMPSLSGERTARLEPAPPAAALRALAPSSIFQLPGAGPQAFETMSRLARELPTYTLHVGQDLASIPAALEQALAGTPPAAT